MGGNKKYEVAEGKCFPFVMLGTQPGLCCVALQMASSIQKGLLSCCCFASPDLSKDSSSSVLLSASPPLLPPSSTGDSAPSAPPLLWRQLRGMGMLRAETILASLTFKSCTWQPGARVVLVLVYEWVDVDVWKALGVG